MSKTALRLDVAKARCANFIYGNENPFSRCVAQRLTSLGHAVPDSLADCVRTFERSEDQSEESSDDSEEDMGSDEEHGQAEHTGTEQDEGEDQEVEDVDAGPRA